MLDLGLIRQHIEDAKCGSGDRRDWNAGSPGVCQALDDLEPLIAEVELLRETLGHYQKFMDNNFSR